MNFRDCVINACWCAFFFLIVWMCCIEVSICRYILDLVRRG